LDFWILFYSKGCVGYSGEQFLSSLTIFVLWTLSVQSYIIMLI